MTVQERVLRALGSERLTAVMAWITVALVAATVLLAAIYGPNILNSTNAVKDGTDLQGCRSQANAMVTEARTEFDVARAERDTAATHLTVLTNEGLVAGVTGDDATFERVLGDLNAARAEVLTAEASVVEATQHLRNVSATYKAKVVQSRENPDAFLRQCRQAS